MAAASQARVPTRPPSDTHAAPSYQRVVSSTSGGAGPDASGDLNHGEPTALARWLDSLDLAPGDRLLHIGCGVGYDTAIAAEAVTPGGSVVAVELDPRLAERAGRKLR